MAKRKTYAKRKPGRQDATMLNVRAGVRRNAKTNDKVRTLDQRIDDLEAEVGRLRTALRHIATV